MRSSRGYTLLELLMTMTMMLLAGAVAFTTALQARKLYDADALRVDLNQNLRSALDMLTAEAQQAGNRLTADFPALELVDDAAGDTLTVRRHLIETVLVSCTDLAVGANRVFVGLTAGAGACALVPDNDADGYPDNVQEYRVFRQANGSGTPAALTNAYIYDPTTRTGEWFSFDDEAWDGGTSGWYLDVTGVGLSAAYPAVNQPRVYILDATQYDLTFGLVEVRRNASPAPLGVVDDVVDFQVTLLMQDSTTRTSFAATDDWTRIEMLQVQLTGERPLHGRTMTRTVSADVFPRNILSH